MNKKELMRFIQSEDQRLKMQYHGHQDPEKHILMRTVKLTEEVGELSSNILAHVGLQRDHKLQSYQKKDLAAEFSDVFITVLLLAASLEINTEEALEQKIEEITRRCNT